MGRLSVDFPHLLGNAPGMVHSPQVHMLSGNWDMSTLPETSTPASVVHGVLGTSGGYSTLTPSPVISGTNLSSYVVSREGISPAGGIDVRWAELVAHNPHPGDNLLYRGHAFLNVSATPDDFFTLMRGGSTLNPTWGAYVQYSGTGFDSFQIVSSNVGPAVHGEFASAVSPGDSLFTGINYATHQLVHQHGAEASMPGALLNLTGMPDDETLYEIVFLVFASGTVALNAGSVSFLCGSSADGRLPLQGSGEAIPPVGATDGREYKVTVGGSYRSYRTLPGDFAKFYNGMQDLQLTRLSSRFTTPVYTVTNLAYDDMSGTLRLELSDGTTLDTTITVPPGVESMSFDTLSKELTTVLSDGSEIVVSIPASGGVTGLTFTSATGELRLEQDGASDVTVTLPTGVQSLAFSQDQLSLTLSDTTVLTADIPAVTGYVAITDIEATDGGNVYNKITSDGGHVLASCTASTTALRVHVLAITGKQTFRPTVLVNGSPVALTRYTSSDSWTGSADITLVGSTITAVHGEGAAGTAAVTVVAPPVVTSASLSGLYPAVGQTKHAAGQVVTLDIEADQAFDRIEVIDDGTTATGAQAFNMPVAAATHSLPVTTANRGASDVTAPAKVRVRNLSGTWSTVVSTANSVTLNNTLPVGALGVIAYLNGFQALRESTDGNVVDVQEATVAFSSTNADTFSFTSPTGELDIVDPALGGTPKTVTCTALAGYNVSTPNLRVVVGRTENATTSIASTAVVFVANTPATVSTLGVAARLRSSPTGQAHIVSLVSTQRLLPTPDLAAGAGAWSGVFTTANQGVTWTRSLVINDAVAKGPAEFSGLVAYNLAGTAVAGLDAGAEDYVVGGFVRRVVQFMPPTDKYQTAIGTPVTDVLKLVATNLSKGPSGIPNVSYSATRVDDPVGGPFTYTVVNAGGVSTPTGAYIYNNDPAADGNNSTTYPAEFEIEETA